MLDNWYATISFSFRSIRRALEFWSWAGSVVTGLYDWLVGVFGKLGSYVVIGAAVVIPIWAAREFYLRLRR